MSMLPICRVVEGLGGDFCKDTYEAKLFGMQIGSLLSGLDAGNVNTDATMLIKPICRVGNVYLRVKRVVLLMFGGLGGDFCKDTYEPKLFGSGWNAKRANNDLKISILPMCRVGTVYVHRVKRVVFATFGGLGGTFVRTCMRQSCLGCILEVF